MRCGWDTAGLLNAHHHGQHSDHAAHCDGQHHEHTAHHDGQHHDQSDPGDIIEGLFNMTKYRMKNCSPQKRGEPNLTTHSNDCCNFTSDESRRPNLTANNILPAAQLSLAITHPLPSAQPFHKTSHQKLSSAMQYVESAQVWRDGLWRRGGDVVAGHRFNLIPVAGTCSYIKGWDLFLHRRRDLIQAICYCHWPAPFLAELFAKPPAKWHTMKAHWYCVQHTFSTPLPCQIFGKLWRVGLSTEC